MSEKAAVSAVQVKDLRERTNAGVMECKRALEEADGDVERAMALLQERGLALAEKRAHRETSQGLIECYIHAGGRIGAMVEVNCETDFVARIDEFKALAHDLAMQVAATNPLSVSEEDLPSGAEGDPAELCLLRQPFIKDESRTVDEVVKEVIARTGENIRVRRFARFELGH
ncbi:MAG: translation elongation factor Ts [Chloroflexi bacterium RBG_16_68_14]|nr:MAG: translation elongation factor Ts [Chloroflexi bacterium RBG_16_68_14]